MLSCLLCEKQKSGPKKKYLNDFSFTAGEVCTYGETEEDLAIMVQSTKME